MRLSRGARRTLRAAIAAIRPRGSGFDQPIDDQILAAIEEFLPHLPAPMRLAFPSGLRLLEWGPPLFARRATRLSAMSVADAQHYLERMLEAGGLRATLVTGLRALVILAFYQHPTVLAAMQVDWAGRAEVLVRRRAALFEGSAQ